MMDAKKNIALITILFKLCSLCLNLATGVLLARNLSVPDRGIGGVVFTIVSIFNIWQGMELNEQSFREKSKKSFIEINLYSQMLMFLFLILISHIFNSKISIFEIFVLIFTSYLNSRLLAGTLMRLGIIAERLFQLLHLILLFSSIVALQLLGMLSLHSWVITSLVIELIFFIILIVSNFPDNTKIKFVLDINDLCRKFHLNNFLLIFENLADRLIIFVISFFYSADNMGILVVAMSFVLIIGIPFTASYPYPIINANKLHNQVQYVTMKKVLLSSSVGFAYLFLCFLIINRFTEVIYGVKYQTITNFSLGLTIAGFGLATTKYLSAIWRGLGKGLFGNVLQAVALTLAIVVGVVSILFSTSAISFYLLFLTWGLINLAFSILVLIKIRNAN
jgi:hypothetical protein